MASMIYFVRKKGAVSSAKNWGCDRQWPLTDDLGYHLTGRQTTTVRYHRTDSCGPRGLANRHWQIGRLALLKTWIYIDGGCLGTNAYKCMVIWGAKPPKFGQTWSLNHTQPHWVKNLLPATTRRPLGGGTTNKPNWFDTTVPEQSFKTIIYNTHMPHV